MVPLHICLIEQGMEDQKVASSTILTFFVTLESVSTDLTKKMSGNYRTTFRPSMESDCCQDFQLIFMSLSPFIIYGGCKE